MLQNHLRSQIVATIAAGHSVTLVCSDGLEIASLQDIAGIRIKLIEIPRSISLWKDLFALWALIVFFRANDFDVVHSTTPKAGLLSMVAAWLARVPVRLHTFTGQPWMVASGFKRTVVKSADCLTARLSSMNYTDSSSQAKFLVDEGVANRDKVKTLGAGSLAGIDCRRFDPQRWGLVAPQMRNQLGLSVAEKVLIFVGRLTGDKGVVELVTAFEKLQELGYSYKLLLVGPFEAELDPLPEHTLRAIRCNTGILSVGYVNEPERYLAISDVLCLPSYREGFGTVVLEAAAMGVPTVGSDIVGIRDAIVDNETGILIPVKDVNALVRELARLMENDVLREEMGSLARQRCLQNFDSLLINRHVIDEYALRWFDIAGTKEPYDEKKF
jgi:glycosyltransferase involved in cell wall biosynthesis